MNKEEIRNASYDVLEERRKQLLAVEGDAFDAEEANAVAERMAELEREGDARRALEARARAAIDSGAAAPIDMNAPGAPRIEVAERMSADAPEYRTAWLKDAAKRGGVGGFETDMTDAERRAFAYMTNNTEAVVPTELQNRIVELIAEDATLLNDITVDNFSANFEIPRHKQLVSGDAAEVNEGEGNADDIKDEFERIALTPHPIAANIELTALMQVQSLSAFEAFIARRVASRIKQYKEGMLLKNLDDATKGMAAANKAETKAKGKLTDSEILGALALLNTGGEIAGTPYIYANLKTIMGTLCEVKDANGRPMYQQATDPALSLMVHGFGVKKDDSIADGTLVIGYPKLVNGNDFMPLSVMTDIDVKTRNTVINGYTAFDAVLTVPRAFAKLTVKAGE